MIIPLIYTNYRNSYPNSALTHSSSVINQACFRVESSEAMGKGEIDFTTPNKKAASASAASPPWAELPVELTENILQRLGVVDILESAQKVCAPWRKVCKHPSLWRVINMIHTRNKYDDDCEVMFRHAVNRSQGQLTDLTIAAIVDRKLLGYIADR